MNKNIQQALLKQRIRRHHKKVLREVALLTEEEANLYTTFVQPFTDIIDAAKLTGQDILNAVRLQFDLLFALGPKSQEKALAAYDKREAAIGKKWDPIMKRNQDALEAGDADLLAMIYAPTFFLTSEAGMAAYDKAEDIYDYLDEAGWRIPLAGALFGGKPPAGSDGGGGGKPDAPDKEKSLLGKLAGLFYIEGAWHRGDLIVEQEEEKPKKSKPPLEKALQAYLEETGLAEKFEADAKEMMKGQQEMIDIVLADVLPKLSLITALTSTVDVDAFVQAIENAEREGLDLQAAGMDKVKEGVLSAAEKLAQSEEFKQKTAETAGIDVEKLPEDKLEEAAKKVAFANAKQEFDKQAAEGKSKLQEAALAFIEENTPGGKTDIEAMKTSKHGIESLKMIDDAKQKIRNT